MILCRPSVSNAEPRRRSAASLMIPWPQYGGAEPVAQLRPVDAPRVEKSQRMPPTA